MKIDNSVINEVRNGVDIVDVISSYIPLQARGKNYFGVCPFHEDHSPSMSVSKEKQIYTCFSCGATGNVFKFLQDYENISFIEAVKKCASIAGITLDIGNVSTKPKKYQELYDMYEVSHKFYLNNMNSAEAHDAKEYLESRDMTPEMIKKFEIGLSLNKNDLLTKLLKSKNFKDKDMLVSGLVGESNNTELYDLYRNRIMFPLHDTNGKVIGYNGRAYHGETSNKYVNSKETPIFKKREVLYNYHRAKDEARNKKEIIIMEGPMDVIRADSIGISNVVASLGTAISHEHALLLRKLSNNVILCFDGDKAGLKATKLAIEELTKVGIEPRIVRLENDSDPDEYIKKNGKDVFLNKLINAMTLLEFKEYELKSSIDLGNTEDLANYANAMIKEISKIEDEVLREVSISKLSEETHLTIDFIKSKVGTPNVKTNDIPVKRKESKKLSKCEKSERNLLFYMLKYADVIKMYDKKITYMPTDKYRHLAFQINAFYKNYGYIDVADLLTELRDDEESINTIGELSSLGIREELNIDEIEDYLENIRVYHEKMQVDKCKEELSKSNSLEEKLRLAQKIVDYKMRSEDNDR